MSRWQLAIEQIDFARNYTIGLPDETPMTEWFRQPPGGGTSPISSRESIPCRACLWSHGSSLQTKSPAASCHGLVSDRGWAASIQERHILHRLRLSFGVHQHPMPAAQLDGLV